MTEERKYLLRELNIYENITLGKLISSIRLTIDEKSVSDITVEDLKSMFKLKKGDTEMYAIYQIKKKHINFFNEKLNIVFDLKKYSYFIETCLAKESEL